MPTRRPSPGTVRSAKSRANLAMAGGQRLEVNLSSIGVVCLDAIIQADPALTKTEAVHRALAREARRVRRRKE